MNPSDFWAMGGYAEFVWPAYAVTLVLLVFNVIAARASYRRAVEEARRRAEIREPAA